MKILGFSAMRLVVFAFIVGCVSIQVSAADLLVTAPPHIVADGEELPLQSRAVREYLWVDVYRIGLYFPEDTSLKSLLKIPAEVAVRIEIMTDRIPEEPPEEWATVFRDHLTTTLSEGLMQGFANLKPGDILWFVHDETGDSRITINREEFATATGYGLMRAMLKLWVGSDPISPELREELIDDYRDD